MRDVRRPGQPVAPAPAKNTGRLVLETSDSKDMLWHGDTVIVDADLLGMPAATPSGYPSTIPAEDQTMAVDTNATIPLVLWLEALIALLAGVVWARHYWGRSQALLIGIPLLLAVTWNIYETVARLLPNLV